jgi:hypothetical protein
MIHFSVVLNDENGLSEMSAAAWTISYDIGYMSSSTSRTLERWNVVNSATYTKSNIFFPIFFLIWKQNLTHIHLSRTRWRNMRIKRLNMSLPMGEVGMKEVRTRMNLLHPLQPLCAKRQRAPGNEDPDYVLEQPIYDY